MKENGYNNMNNTSIITNHANGSEGSSVRLVGIICALTAAAVAANIVRNTLVTVK